MATQEEDAKAKAAAAKKAEDDKKKQEAAAAKFKYFVSKTAAGLTVLKQDGSTVRFTVFFDTYKGDKVRVGYLKTDDKEVISRLEQDAFVDSVTEKEYNDSVKELSPAPVYSV